MTDPSLPSPTSISNSRLRQYAWIALAIGEGGEQNAPLGRAVIGGLIVATFVTLFIVPAVYTLVRKAPPSAHKLDAKFAAESRGASEASHA